jgi:7-keto-8-aminopelargonate synthetase-like enzyme
VYVELLWVGLALLMVWSFVGINILGARSYERTLIPLMVLMFALGAVVIVTGFSYDQTDFARALALTGRSLPAPQTADFDLKIFLAAAAILFSSFIGFDSIAQAGAVAGLLDEEHQRRTRELTDEGRAFLERSFAEMGLEYVPSSANFVLVKVGDGDAVFQAMLRRGVIVRAMRGYKLPEWVRISVGTMPENERCIATLKEVLGGTGSA